MERISTGQRAPDFDLLAAGSGRRVSLETAAGGKLVLIFHLQGTAPTAQEINRSVRTRYPSPDAVLVASVIDLSIVPPVYWPTVNLVLASAYQQATSQLPPDSDPEDYIIILPDYGGFVSRRFGARNTGRAAAIAVIDEDSNVVGNYQGEEPVEAVLQMLEET